MSWTESEKAHLIRLHSQGKYFWKEIAKILNKKPNVVSHCARLLALKQSPHIRGRMGKWNIKHKHLQEPVMRYFLNHTIGETRERFGLTQSEIKSIFTVGYRDPNFKHLRKETRRHDSWSLREILFLIRHSGLQPRSWVSRKLKRGGVHAVKESLTRLNTTSKCMNGIPHRWATVILGEQDIPNGIKTKAGPLGGGGRGDCRYRIIPWVEMEKLVRNKHIDPQLKIAIQAMARFQRWIHGSKSDRKLLEKLTRMAGEK